MAERGRRRLVRLALAVAVIACGLALRYWGPDAGLPQGLVKYGGSTLWGTMVLLLVAAVAVDRPLGRAAALAAGIALAVELSRLVHTPDLDAFRPTLAGRLLLGRVFSLWNLVAYALGIALGAAVLRRIERGRT